MKKNQSFRILYKLYKQLHSLYMEHNNPYNPYYAYELLKDSGVIDYRCTNEGYKRYLAKSEHIKNRLKRVSNRVDFMMGAYNKNKGLE